MKSAEKRRKTGKDGVVEPKTTLDQWVALLALVDHGGYEAAAEALGRSPSAVSYQVARLQAALRTRLLVVRGRRATLTPHGVALLVRARGQVDGWRSLEAFARSLRRGNEALLRIAADMAFPRERLIGALLALRRRCPETQVDLSEVVLSGAEEALVDGAADVAVTAHVPRGFLGDWLCEASFVACASPSHPLHALGRAPTRADLERHQQAVLRDSGTRAPRSEGYLGAALRWTVGGMDTAMAVVEAGLAYAWLPKSRIGDAIAAGRLKALPLESGAVRRVPLYVVLSRPTEAGPVARAAVELLHTFASAPAGASGH